MTSERDPLNPFGTIGRLILLGVTVVAVFIYALDGGHLVVIPILAVMGLLYHYSFRGLSRFFENLFNRRDR